VPVLARDQRARSALRSVQSYNRIFHLTDGDPEPGS